jgi:CubicO group peptidase (beta-lactamase class C family)
MSTTTRPKVETIAEVEVHGKCPESFRAVRDVLARHLSSGADIGASAAVFIDGQPVVDIWGGFRDGERTQAWKEDTIVNMFSTTKTMTALALLIVIDRGGVKLDDPIAKYWPEFAAESKGDITVRNLMHYEAGLAGWSELLTLDDLYDREKSTAMLAAQAPWWKRGSACGYHPISFGPLYAEVIRRATGLTLSEFFAKEVAGPLGADYFIGTPPEADARVSPMIQSSPIPDATKMDRMHYVAYFNPFISPQVGSSIGWRRAELGGSNGHGNARSVALIQSVLACGGEVNGVRLLSEEGCERVFDAREESVDIIMHLPIRWGLGYAVNAPIVDKLYGGRLHGHRIACWGGSGGSWVVNDLDERMTVAYVMNRHVEGAYDQRHIDIVNATYDSLAALK